MARRALDATAQKDAAEQYGILLERCSREASNATPAKVQEFKDEVRNALQDWARITDNNLEVMRELVSHGRGRMPLGEAQDHWNLLDQLKNEVYQNIEDQNSLLEDYEPLQRMAAQSTLRPFWDRFDAAFNEVESYRDTLSMYQEVGRQQVMTEIRNYERLSRADSNLVRGKLTEFIDLARPLMQAVGKL